MRVFILLTLMISVCGISNAQCIAEIKNVVQDEQLGTIVVETEYTLNGNIVQYGKTRYTENSGTNAEIILKAKEDVEKHCDNLIRRISGNKTFRDSEALKLQKSLTSPIISSIKDDLIGYKTIKKEVVDIYKTIEIKVTADEKNTVTSISSIPQ